MGSMHARLDGVLSHVAQTLSKVESVEQLGEECWTYLQIHVLHVPAQHNQSGLLTGAHMAALPLRSTTLHRQIMHLMQDPASSCWLVPQPETVIPGAVAKVCACEATRWTSKYGPGTGMQAGTARHCAPTHGRGMHPAPEQRQEGGGPCVAHQ